MNWKRPAISVSDRALSRILRGVVLVLVAGIPLFGLKYFLDQRVSAGPTLPDRQVTVAENQVRAQPGNIGFRLALAQAYGQDKRPDDALTQYDEVLKIQPTNRAALMGRGGVLLDKHDLAGAAAAYRKVVLTNGTGEFAGADPQLEEAHYYLGLIAFRRGSPELAITELRAALKIDQTDADAWDLLGTALLRTGSPAGAVAAFRSALMFVPTGWCDPYRQLATAYGEVRNAAEEEYAGAMVDFCEHRPDQATRRLTALTASPAAVDALLGLGMVAESTGNRDQAITYYQQVRAADPKNASAVVALSRLGVKPAASPAVSSSTAGNK